MNPFLLAQLDPENIDALIGVFVQGVQGGRLSLIAAAGVMLAVQLFKLLIAPRFNAPWMTDKRFTVALGLAGSVAGACVSALIGGVPITAGLIVAALATGFMGIGVFSAQKNFREGMAPPKTAALSVVIGKEPGEPLK
jgi:hypothetical protein